MTIKHMQVSQPHHDTEFPELTWYHLYIDGKNIGQYWSDGDDKYLTIYLDTPPSYERAIKDELAHKFGIEPDLLIMEYCVAASEEDA